MKHFVTPKVLRKSVLFVGLTLLCTISIGIASPQKASAVLPAPWPGLFPFAMPSDNFNSLYHCNEPAWNPSLWSPTFTQWISISGQAATTTITVPWGTPSVALDLHISAATCVYSGGSVIWANTAVSNIYTPGVDPALRGRQLPFYLGAGSPVGTYATNATAFTYAPPGGFTSSADHVITLGTKSINQFPTNPQFRCVGAIPITTNSLNNFGPCQEAQPQFRIRVNVGPRPDRSPLLAIYSECTNRRVVLQTNDPDGGSLGIQYRIYNAASPPTGSWVTPSPSTRTVGPGVNATWNIDMSTYAATTRWRIEARTRGRGPGNTNPTVGWVTVVTGNHAAPNNDYVSCGSTCTASFSPSNVEQGGQLTPSIRITNNTPGTMTGPLRITIRAPDGSSVAPFTPLVLANPATLAPGANSGLITLSAFTASQMGVYTMSAVYNGLPASPDTCASATVVNKPYVRAYGSDISAGSSNGCTGWGAAGAGNIRGFRGYADAAFTTPDVTKGSGAQLGVFARGTIDNTFPTGFSSAVLRGGPPSPPIGLSFANTGPFTPGFFTTGAWCPYDYWGNRTAGPAPNTADLNLNANGSYQTAGSITVSNQLISDGKQLVIYVNGDLTLSLNGIFYAGSGGWNSAADIASVVFVASGNIYIDRSVNRLDGVYIAQGGTIYTCTNGTAQVANSSKFSQCNTQLTVNGSLVGRNVKWQRTYGSARDSATGENPLSVPRADCSNRPIGASTITCASEYVNYTPDVYAIPGVLGIRYDYVTALPPIL